MHKLVYKREFEKPKFMFNNFIIARPMGLYMSLMMLFRKKLCFQSFVLKSILRYTSIFTLGSWFNSFANCFVNFHVVNNIN